MNESPAQLRQQLAVTKAPHLRFPLLIKLLKRIIRQDLHGSLALASEALLLAESQNNQIGIVESLRLIGQCEIDLSRYPEAAHHLDQAFALAESLENPFLKATVRHTRTSLQRFTGDTTVALGALLKNLQFFEECRDNVWILDTLLATGIVCVDMGHYDRGLDMLLRSLTLADRQGMSDKLLQGYGVVSVIYFRIEEYEKALAYNFKALDIANRIKDDVAQAFSLMHIGTNYLYINQFDLALRYFTEALEGFNALGYHGQELYVLSGMSEIYQKTGNTYQAELYYKRILEKTYAMPPHLEYNMLHGYGALAALCKDKKDYKTAIAHLKKALLLTHKFSDRPSEYQTHEALAEFYELSGNMRQAFKHHKLCVALKEELIGKEKQKAVQNLEFEHIIRQIEHEKSLRDIRMDQLQQEMAQKNKELTLLALQLAQKNEYLSKLREQITILPELNKATSRLLAKHIDQALQAEENWQIFSEQFRQVHQEFYPRLLKNCSTLTPTELRICCLVKLSLSSKDMASLLCISVRTVEVHRQSIRKKMCLFDRASLPSLLAAM